ncbi:MAG: cytochrome c oxidase subunit 3 [Chloroflexota bacterium]
MSAVPQPEYSPAEQSVRVNRLGITIFIMSEAVLFANLIAGYLYLRFTHGQWPPEGTPELELLLPGVNTLILIGSGIPMHLAHKAAERGDRRTLIWGTVATLVMGLIFISGQGWEYTHAGFTPQTNVFGSTFFGLTGFHGAHVLVGLTFLSVVLVLSLRGRFSREHHFPVEAAALYWHFVDAVWVVLFAVLYIL